MGWRRQRESTTVDPADMREFIRVTGLIDLTTVRRGASSL